MSKNAIFLEELAKVKIASLRSILRESLLIKQKKGEHSVPQNIVPQKHKKNQ